jgi:hypothetical protein
MTAVPKSLDAATQARVDRLTYDLEETIWLLRMGQTPLEITEQLGRSASSLVKATYRRPDSEDMRMIRMRFTSFQSEERRLREQSR